MGSEFQLLLQSYGIKDVATTVKNPQANAVVEQLHQTMANILRTFINTAIATKIHPQLVI